MRKAFIFDLDGTLADGNGRDFYNPSDQEIMEDLAIDPVVDVLIQLKDKYEIIFLSGREACFYEPTKWWIRGNLGILDPILYMRKTRDSRKDSIIKLELYNDKIKPNYDIIGVFDDRLQVCRMWYEQGIFVFNVNQGLKEF